MTATEQRNQISPQEFARQLYGIDIKTLPYISESDRLVARDFVYGPEQIKKEFLNAMKQRPVFTGYPQQEDRLHMTEQEYLKWLQEGKSADKLVGKLPGKWFVGKHANRYAADGLLQKRAQPYDGTQTFPKGAFGNDVEQASDGSPLHPFFKDAVTGPDGMPTGPGFYWSLGKNQAADPVIVRINNGRLEVLVIEGTDGRGFALPGGMVDPEDAALSKRKALSSVEAALAAAMREAGEEANIKSLHDVFRVPILLNTVVGDWRSTAQAWPETSVFLFMPDSKTSEKMEVKAADDAKAAQWKTFGSSTRWKGIDTNLLFASHGNYVKKALKKFEELTGLVVTKDGCIGQSTKVLIA